MTRQYELGALLLRVALGLIFVVHGLSKFQGGIDNTAGWFQSIGLPGFAAYLIALIELAGGIALVVGLGTRIVSGLFIAIMLGAIIKVKFAAGFLNGFELELALMVMALYLAFNGSKMLSVDSKLSFAKRGV